MHDLWPATMKNCGCVDINIHMTSEMDLAPDIAILLAHTWQNHNGESIDGEAVCRIWAFDLGWFDMETATRVRDNLLDSSWLDQNSVGLKPAFDISSIEVPFGWLPTMRLLENPPPLPKGVKAESIDEVSTVVKPETTPVETAPVDPASSHITELLDQIAQTSGLDRKEVMRRAQRKRRALGPVTLWMSLLLVAREQKLPMKGFMQTISA